jgi:biopolymer transport protein ExbD
MKRHIRGEESAEIDLTPMLDVTFIMLIFFIVTTSFSKEMGIDVNRPSTSNVQQTQSTAVIGVSLKANGEVQVDGRVVDLRAVRANVERVRAEKPDAPVIVATAKSASTGTLVAVIDQVKEAGAEKISVAAVAD